MAAQTRGKTEARRKTRDKAGTVEKEVYLPMRVMFQGLKGEMKEG